MKTKYIICSILGFLILLCSAFYYGFSYYLFEREYIQLWELADKSSTISAKRDYIAKFVAVLERGNERGCFAAHNAVFLRTPNNGFVENLQALRTLANRLDEIQAMSPSSFEYNTAIQQITAQEQGEAKDLIGVIRGCYFLKSWPMAWQWLGGTVIAFGVILVLIPLGIWMNDHL